MEKYSYKAVNSEGKYIKGSITVSGPSELSAILKADGLDLISHSAESKKFITLTDNRVKTKDLITTFIHLEQLDRAGVSIIDSISDLKDSSDSAAVKSMMQEIYESIKNGSLFSEAMSNHKKIFNSVYIGLIASGEKTGNLAQAFSSIVEDLKWSIDFKAKVKKAAVGPSFAIFLMTLIIGVMMGFVVPKVTGFLAVQEIEMPRATKSLIALSGFVQNYWMIILICIPSIYVIFKILGKIPEVGVNLDAIKLRIPIIGPILVKLDAARFCQFFSMTFKSGLGVIESLESSSKVVKNEAIKRNILYIRHQVSEGKSLGGSISKSKYFPSLVIRMFKVGEESGNMDQSLENIKYFYDREINDSIDRLVSMIQPALTMIMGAMILWVVTAVFGPIYGSFSNIK